MSDTLVDFDDWDRSGFRKPLSLPVNRYIKHLRVVGGSM